MQQCVTNTMSIAYSSKTKLICFKSKKKKKLEIVTAIIGRKFVFKILVKIEGNCNVSLPVLLIKTMNQQSTIRKIWTVSGRTEIRLSGNTTSTFLKLGMKSFCNLKITISYLTTIRYPTKLVLSI